MDARLGEQSEVVQKALAKRTPPAASASMCGRLHVLRAIAAERVGPQIVAEDEEDVGRVGRGAAGVEREKERSEGGRGRNVSWGWRALPMCRAPNKVV